MPKKEKGEVTVMDKVQEMGDEDKLFNAATGLAPENEDIETEGPNVKEQVCAIYDGSIESAIMIHKLAKENDKEITVLQGPTVKFDKLKLKTKEIEGIGAIKKDGILDYIKKCGQHCIDNLISKLYIGWTIDLINSNPTYVKADEEKGIKGVAGELMFQDLFMNGIPQALDSLEIVKKDDKGNMIEHRFVRPVFYNYGTATADIEKNKKQYGYE